MSALTIGLTGGVASGKSYMAARFQALGVPLLEADDVARAVVAAGEPALAAIAACFGPRMLLADGTLDRRRLREHVFADAAARRQLEAITHPAIHIRVRDWRAAQDAPYCIYSAAILVEAGMADQVDRVLVVDASPAQQRQRLTERDQVDVALADRMLGAQATRDQRLARADDVIDNDDTGRDPGPQIARLHHLYLGLAAARR